MEHIYNEPGGVVKLIKLTMPRVLVLGKDEREIVSIVASVAGLSHFVTSCWDEMSLANAVANGSPDLVLIDMRSDGNALAHAKELIAQYDQVSEASRGAIVESAEISDLQSKYIHDFILYPYETTELATRLGRLLNKSQTAKSGKLINIDGLVIDTESFEVSIDGRQLALTFKEFELLRFLATYPGRVHTREALLNKVWGYEYFGGLRTVDVHVRRIRAKLGLKHDNLIQTVHGVGYKFIA